MIAESMKRHLIRSEDYSPRVGVRKATANVGANAVVSAAPAAFIVTVLRHNNWAIWPEIADASAAAFIMAAFTGIVRFAGDWLEINHFRPRYRARQAAQEPQEEQA